MAHTHTHTYTAIGMLQFEACEAIGNGTTNENIQIRVTYRFQIFSSHIMQSHMYTYTLMGAQIVLER